MDNIVLLGTGVREDKKVYHYMCMLCGNTFVSFIRGNYHHACVDEDLKKSNEGNKLLLKRCQELALEAEVKLLKIKKIAQKHYDERYNTDWDSMQKRLHDIWKLTK